MSTEPAMMLPTVHRNGTGKEALLEQACNALRAIRAAQEAMGNAFPNARDYYVQGPDAFERASRQWEARIDALREIYTDLEAIAEHIADA